MPKDGSGGSDGLSVPYWLAKILGILVGGALTVLALMALTGTLVENGWIRLGVALVVGLGVPIFVADRLLPDDDPTAGKGIPTDVLAVFFSGIPLVYFGLLGGFTADWTRTEGDRQTQGGMQLVGDLAYALSNSDTESETSQAEGASGDNPVDADAGAQEEAGAADAGTDSGSATDEAEAEAEEEAEEAEPESPEGELSSADLFSRWAPSVVAIQIGPGGGTGFVLNRDGVVATNQHVVGDSPQGVRVKLHDGSYARDVWLLWSDAALDLALIQIATDTTLRPVRLADSESVQVGERAVAIGNPLGLEHTLTEGIVSSRRVYNGRRMIQMSTPVSPGNSGGPLFRGDGEVIGVVTAQVLAFGRAQNLNLAVPINEIKSPLDESYPDRTRIGGGGGSEGGSW